MTRLSRVFYNVCFANFVKFEDKKKRRQFYSHLPLHVRVYKQNAARQQSTVHSRKYPTENKQAAYRHTYLVHTNNNTYIHTYIHTCIHTYIRARSKGISLIGKACAATVSAKFAPHRNFCTPPWFVALNISQYFNPSDPSSCPDLRSYTPPPASEHEPAYVLVRVKRGFPSPWQHVKIFKSSVVPRKDSSTPRTE